VIVSQPLDVLATWLCSRIGLTPTADLRCIGRVSKDGPLMAVIGFDNWNGAACEMHVAGEGNWISRDLLFAAFDYPFNVGGCGMVLGRVPSKNYAAVRLNLHLGFKIEHTIVGGHPDGALHIMAMRRAECRWLKRESRHGEEKHRRAVAA
jgi:RimJ/RimL family protein N-acetyltransferase